MQAKILDLKNIIFYLERKTPKSGKNFQKKSSDLIN
jgi:hypothetical protein